MTSNEDERKRGSSPVNDGSEIASAVGDSADAGSAHVLASQFPVLRQEALYERIASHVRNLIATKQLQSGQRLPAERELATMLGVSRVPIREAMRTLAAQGLVDIRRGQGIFVASNSVDATVEQLTSTLLDQRDLLTELFAVRRLLEPASAQWAAARRSDGELDRLEGLLDEMRAAGENAPPDFDRIGECDSQLHLQVATASHNRVLLRLMEAIQDLHQQQLETSLRYRDRVDETVQDHARIVRAIAARDPIEAASAMSDNLANGESATMRGIEGGATSPS